MRKFTQSDLEILARAQLHADLSIEKLSKQCKCKAHIVNYTLNKMIRAGQIKKIGAIDFSALGLQETIVRFSLNQNPGSSREKVFKALLESERVVWLVATGGRLPFAMSVLARTQYELLEYLERFSDRFGSVFARKSFCHVAQHSFWGRRYLTNERVEVKPLELQLRHDSKLADRDTHRLLQILSEDYAAPLTTVARKLGLPATTVGYRIKRLEEQGIINRYIYTLNVNELQLYRYYIFIHSRGVSHALTLKLRELMESTPEVISLYRGLGEWDYALRVETFSATTAYKLQEQIFAKFDDSIIEIDTVPVLNVMKLVNYPFEKYETIFGSSQTVEDRVSNQ